MEESDFLYYPFPSFIFRSPLFPYSRLPEADFNNVIFNDALYLASPEFFREKQKWEQEGGKSDKKISVSLYKYYSRACTRSTPFGLFAGCSVGKIGKETDIVFEDLQNCKKHIRLDMNYMCALIQYIEKLPEIRRQLRYFPNDSIYYLGDKIRYIEYYYKGVKRIHNIQAVDDTEFLRMILEASVSGKNIAQLAGLCVQDDIAYEEAEEFINELIDNQLLKSELEAAVTGDDLLEGLIGKLKCLESTGEITALLADMREQLSYIDRNPSGNNMLYYKNLLGLIEKFPVKYDEKYLFQIDLFKPAVTARIAEEVIRDIQNTLEFLMRIRSLSPPDGETNLDKCKKAFLERYEEQEMPLLHVMDPDSGIGYPPGSGKRNINPLINDLPYVRRLDSYYIQLSPLECILLKKYEEILSNGAKVIELKEEDIPIIKIDGERKASTMMVMCQLFAAEDEKPQLFLQMAGGITASALLGRFGYLDDSMLNVIKEITRKEQEAEPDKIIAEIVHLPESRIGNIAFRPLVRDYEIHYLARPGVGSDRAIPASDLLISVRNNRFVLRSRNQDKEIVPRLSNAHNYSLNSLPVYHFLCDLQFQDKQVNFSLSNINLLNIFKSFPRVIYKNTILIRQMWIVNKSELEKIREDIESDPLPKINSWRTERKIKEKVTIQDGDNELYIDFTYLPAVNAFISILLKREELTLCEFLFGESESPVKDKKGLSYCNEFIFPFYKK